MAFSKPTNLFRGVLSAALSVIVVVALSGVRGYGQCTLSSPSQWNVASGNWSVAGDWTPSGVPNSATTNVCLTNGTSGTPATTMLDINAAVGDLQLGSFNALNISTGLSLTLDGATVSNAGAINLNGGGGANSFSLIGSDATLSGGGTLTLSTASGGGNTIIQQNVSGLTLTNANNTIQGNGVIGNNGMTLVNGAGGRVLANVSGQTLALNGGRSVTNNGGFVAFPGSTLHVTGGSTLTNFSTGTLTGGTYRANGTIQIDSLGATGGEIVTNNASIILDGLGGGAALISDLEGKNALSNLATNQGSLFLLNGGNANFTTAGDLENSGTVTVGSGTTLALGSIGASSLNQSAGLTQGNGTIAGKVAINGGKLLPGEAGAPGTLTINGATSLNGTFEEQIGSASNFSVLNVGVGNLTLGSASLLHISLLGSFNPVGNSFTIMNAAGGLVSGTFSNAPASGFAMGGVNWTIAYNSSDVVLNALSLVGGLVTSTWNTASGNWTTATGWACSPGPSTCVPNNNPGNTYGAVVNSPGDTLTLDSTSSPSSVTVNTLSLQAGTLDVGSGAVLNLANQSNGVTDIPNGAGLSIEGSFSAGTNNGLYKLTSVEGSLTLDNGQTTGVTPTGGTLTVSSTGVVKISGSGTAAAVNGGFANAGSVTAGMGGALTATTYDNTGDTAVAFGGALNTTATSGNTYIQTSGITDVSGTLTTYQYDVTGGWHGSLRAAPSPPRTLMISRAQPHSPTFRVISQRPSTITPEERRTLCPGVPLTRLERADSHTISRLVSRRLMVR